MTAIRAWQGRLAGSAVWALVLAWLVFGAVYALGTTGRLTDDPDWLQHARLGLGHIWSAPSPYAHFRPVFGTWIWLLAGLGCSSPAALAAAGVGLGVVAAGLTYGLLRQRFSPDIAAVGAALVMVHPLRREHLFWASAQIDLLCFVLCLAALLLCARGLRRHGWVQLLWLSLLTALACGCKETAGALPVLALFIAPRGARLRAFVASLLGALASFAYAFHSLQGLGRAGGLVRRASLRNLVSYPARLALPGDWSYQHLARGLQAGDGHAIALVALTALLAGAGLWGIAALRRTRGFGVAMALLGAGALAWFVGPSDRSIWFGLVGAAWLACLGLESKRSRTAWVLACMVPLWIAIWSDATVRFRLAQRQSSAITQALARDPSVLSGTSILLGVPRGIARQAYVPLTGGRCVLIVVGEKTFPARAAHTRLEPSAPDELRIHPTGADAYLRCHIGASLCGSRLPEPGAPLTLDLSALRSRLEPAIAECGPLAIHHWDGSAFQRVHTGGR